MGFAPQASGYFFLGSLVFFIYLLKYFFLFLYMCGCGLSADARKDLELELRAVVSCLTGYWRLSLGTLAEEQVLLIAEPSL